MNNEFKNGTGIPELDHILEDVSGLDIEPMPIDKKVFDSVILPLLRNELTISNDDSFTHLKNIWINYYKNYSTQRQVVFKENNGLVAKPMGGNALYIPMAIKDSNGVIVDTTPPLLEPTLIVGMNDILEAYTSELKHNPNVAKVKLLNTIKQFTISTNQEWVLFLGRYNSDGVVIIDDDNDDLIIRG